MSDSQNSKDGSHSGEILPPEQEAAPLGAASFSLNQTLIAAISNYTERPDLVLAELEKHDPGFVRRMNAASEEHAKEERAARFKFGKVQAYTSLAVSVVAAFGVFGLIFYALFKSAGFFPLLALVLLYAVTQGGPAGFIRVIEALKNALSSKKDDKE